MAALNDVAEGCHSWLELAYLRQVERPPGLPRGSRQSARRRRGGRWYDDVHYDAYSTMVELDGRAAHPEESRQRDRRRDNAAALEGLSVLRYGTTDVAERACETAAQVASALRRNGWRGHPTCCGPDCAVAHTPAGGPGRAGPGRAGPGRAAKPNDHGGSVGTDRPSAGSAH